MADAIEIARDPAESALNRYMEYQGPICDHHPDECPKECHGQIAWKAEAELKAMRRTILAQQPVVEAAGHQTDCADNLPNPDAGYEKNRVARMNAWHKATDATERAVRAMRGAKRADPS